MRVLVFEDERLTAERLVQLIHRYDKTIEITGILESVEQGLEWLDKNDSPDLIFMDIHLSDGPAFDLFNHINIQIPIIFTTAYDQYAIKAFKVNSVSYLLKPIDFNELVDAVEKYKSVFSGDQKQEKLNYSEIFKVKEYKERFLVKIGDQLKHIGVNQIAYFYYDDGVVEIVSYENKKLPVEMSLDLLEKSLNPKIFFRINRKYIVNVDSIRNIHSYFNSRLKLDLKPESDEEIIVSRDRVSEFKKWLGY